MRPTTKALMAKHGWRIDRAIHNYVYFSFYAPYVWIMTQVVDRVAPHLDKATMLTPVFKMMVNRYHAKMLTDDNISKVLELRADISAVTDKNRGIVPFTYAYKILLEDPEFIAVMDCPCKKAAGVKNPDDLNSCICVGKKTAEFWLDRCADKYNARRITQQEALDMVRSFRKRGYVTQVFFKVATGGSAGVVCNCHKDSCTALRAHLTMRSWDRGLRVVAESGYSVSHDASRCADCGTCVKICQFAAVESENGKRTGYLRQNCMGCGLCVEHCPQGALEQYRDMEKLVPLDLDIVRREYL